MTQLNELYVSAKDAEALAAMLGSHRRANPFEADASDDLADLLMEARLVTSEALPKDRVAMSSTVTYREEPSGAMRTVTLALPAQADMSAGRISVLSPIGRALIGRKRGSVVQVTLPGGRTLNIRILQTGPQPEALRETA